MPRKETKTVRSNGWSSQGSSRSAPTAREISQKSNERYADSLATVKEVQPLGELTERLSRPQPWQGRRVRALNPLAESDAALLQALARGEFLINGLRDLRTLLYQVGRDPRMKKRARCRARGL